MNAWLPEGLATASPATQLMASLLLAIFLLKMIRWVLAVLGVGS